MMDKLPCIVCGTPLNNVLEDGLQPMDGLAFETLGHYGSTVFDPMNGSWLEIAICDNCLVAAAKERRVLFTPGSRMSRIPKRKPQFWSPPLTTPPQELRDQHVEE